ncbi:BC1881 family protein [Bacillus sp. S56]|uniref:BC1881 family protein n=1 Tax=Bacillus sp. S56 TaxID=1226987 RepID=UPI00190C0FB9|nr:BC1881 family protein [Bacillus sp. S56]MBK0076617.1 BC1881 family protein [Bacillus sp. S56]
MKRMPTQELSNELKKRKGITSIKIEPYEKIEVGGIVVDGPAVILINQEYLKIVK